MTRQYCSVCKEWLDMEVVPTSDGDDDDGVAWYRCPQCQGFLPKLKNAVDGDEEPETDPSPDPQPASERGTEADVSPAPAEDETVATGGKSMADLEAGDVLPWDSPADMTAAQQDLPDLDLPDVDLPDVDLPEQSQGAAETFTGELTDEVVDLIGPMDEVSVLPEADPVVRSSDDDDFLGERPRVEEPAPVEPLHEYAAMLAAKDPLQAVPYKPWRTYELDQCIHHMAWDDCGVVVGKEFLPGGRQVIKVYFEEAGVVRLIEGAER